MCDTKGIIQPAEDVDVQVVEVPATEDQESNIDKNPKKKRMMPQWQKQLKMIVSGSHSKREWLLLGERVFSHPRYAVVVMMALALCFFERYLFVILPMVLFFSIEWCMRFWLQKERGFRNKIELTFLVLDGIATISMLFTILMPVSLLEQGIYLRIARLFRGMYMLRMLRIFRFLTYDAIVFSLPLSLCVVAVGAIAWGVESVAIYLGVLLVLETLYRAYSIHRVLPHGKRRTLEFSFIPLDMLGAVAVMGLVPALSTIWVLLRLGRFLIMLNPLGRIAKAAKHVLGLPEIRQEGSMLAGLFVAYMIIGSVAMWFIYPHMDVNSDNLTNDTDYTAYQVLLYVFRLMIDPGAAPAEAFSPWIAIVTVVLVISGVFFFALVVSLGSNVMKYMLDELANSSLSAREHILFMGHNEQALPILHKVGQMCARMQHAFPSVWIFHGQALTGAAQVGTWLSIREVAVGTRNIVEKFKITGVRQLVMFLQKQYEPDAVEVADMHHLARELNVDSLLISDSAMSKNLTQVYKESLNMQAVDSASVRARMLYQMHHCSEMPELGIQMFDVVSGETGLKAMPWNFKLVHTSAGAMIKHEQKEMLLEAWLTNCFEEGLNVLAARRDDGSYVLFSDLVHIKHDETFSVIIVLGRERLLWAGIMNQSFSLVDRAHANELKAFTWPETWDLSMMFLGWHPGLPSMIEEMAERHHKLTCHVFSTCDGHHLEIQQKALADIEDKVNRLGHCQLKAEVLSWDGLDTAILAEKLRGCKVMMLYPEDRSDKSEDSLLELWFHEVASMLTKRKEKTKWWSPPKLMVLPRNRDFIPDFMEASQEYSLLDIRVGSPDAFHDVFMARQLLTQARKTQYPEEAESDAYVYEFMDDMLGDAVLVEDIASVRLLDENKATQWDGVYREALRRGWMLMAYLKTDMNQTNKTMFSGLDKLFPRQVGQDGDITLFAGSPVTEMDAPKQTSTLFFCRRGILNNETKKVKKIKPEVVKPEAVNVEEVKPEAAKAEAVKAEAVKPEAVKPEEISSDEVEPTTSIEETMVAQSQVVEGEVMSETVWPKQADKRLLRTLQKQVEGSVELLSNSSEEALIKLMGILDMGVSPEVEGAIMDALTDLQSIDRVSQRLNNVKSCLDDWATAQPDMTGTALWEEEVSKRYVMEEEKVVLRGEL
ncbi:MAG: hypothetical protein R8M14_08010 [Ghiorsea sp.]